jgi:hypothetical protein
MHLRRALPIYAHLQLTSSIIVIIISMISMHAQLCRFLTKFPALFVEGR